MRRDDGQQRLKLRGRFVDAAALDQRLGQAEARSIRLPAGKVGGAGEVGQ